MIMVMDFRLTYDTNLAQVKKIMKQVGDEIAADPELKRRSAAAAQDGRRRCHRGQRDRRAGEVHRAARRGALHDPQGRVHEDHHRRSGRAGSSSRTSQVTVNVPPSQMNDEAMAACGRRGGAARRFDRSEGRALVILHVRRCAHALEERADEPHVYSINGVTPVVDPSAYVHPSAVLIGDVIVGAGCYVGPTACLRGDFGRLEMRAGANVQDSCILHAYPGVGTLVEEDGHIGHGAILHGCIVRRNALVG
jgi:small-conductance mechanosensitive channel